MKRGFTLIELAIVLVLVGLLIGGVLIAQSIIDNAKVNSLIKEVNHYQILSQQFKSRFEYLPGDLPNALNLFSSCNNGGSGCNGNGDGNIHPTGTPNSGRYENVHFWHHLHLAGFTDETYGTTYAAGSVADTPIGVNVPQLEYHELAGLQVENGGLAWPTARGDQNFFVIGGNVDGYYQSDWLEPGITKPSHAASLDHKIDDGIPNAGDVLSFNSVTTNGGDEAFCFPTSESVGGGSAATASTYSFIHDDHIGGCKVSIAIEEF